MKERFFRLQISDKISRPLEIIGLPAQYKNVVAKSDFDKLNDHIVAYFRGKDVPEISGVLSQPSFLVCDDLKLLLQVYDLQFQAKAIQLFAGEMESKENYLYWLPYIESINCLHSDTEKYSNGMLKHLVLEGRLLPNSPIFRVNGLLEDIVVISLPLAESILRRCFYGIQLNPVEVK